MKNLSFFFLLTTCSLLVSCKQPEVVGQKEPVPSARLCQIDSLGWIWEKDSEIDFTKASFQTTTDRLLLHFYGWKAEEDSVFHVSFPESTEQFGRAILTYKMCGWNQGPAEWDMTTLIMIKDKESGEWYEFVRVITPYGGSFGPDWEKKSCIDITEFLPMMKGATDFRIFYCGWDATAERSHAAELTFSFFEGEKLYGTPCGHEKIYDSTLPNEGSNGYRAWSYGVEGYSIEDASRLGKRTIHIPAGTKSAILRVCITGHGQDANNGTGTFPDRNPKKAKNAAEFDENHYTWTLNGCEVIKQQGYIWEINGGRNHYAQAGTYTYNRAGWGPGKPCNVQHWRLDQIPAGGETLTLDMDLERYISPSKKPNQEYVACYYVEVDAYYFK